MCDIRRAGCGVFQSPASAEELKNQLVLKSIFFFCFKAGIVVLFFFFFK